MTVKTIIEQWQKEAGVRLRSETTVFHIDSVTNTLYILTQYPGWYIGYHGELINKYKTIFREENYYYDIKFIELGLEYVLEF